MRGLLGLLVACSINVAAYAQCENGGCQVPTKAPVLQAIAAPLVSVLEAQPVRKTIAATVNFGLTVPQLVRQVKPARSVVCLSLRVVNQKVVQPTLRYGSNAVRIFRFNHSCK